MNCQVSHTEKEGYLGKAAKPTVFRVNVDTFVGELASMDPSVIPVGNNAQREHRHFIKEQLEAFVALCPQIISYEGHGSQCMQLNLAENVTTIGQMLDASQSKKHNSASKKSSKK